MQEKSIVVINQVTTAVQHQLSTPATTSKGMQHSDLDILLGGSHATMHEEAGPCGRRNVRKGKKVKINLIS